MARAQEPLGMDWWMVLGAMSKMWLGFPVSWLNLLFPARGNKVGIRGSY
jgi:hypothetical protein